jgi:Tat protein translocase TatB subunit
MNGTIFGVGPLEVLVIGVIILLVFGPERLPELTRGLGTALRRLRETYVSFTQEFRGELEPIAQDIDEVTREIRQEVDAIRQAADIRTILQPYADDVNKAVKLQEIPAAPTKIEPQPPALPSSNTSASVSANATSNTIVPPKQLTAGARTNGKHTHTPIKPASANLSAIELPEDNPWVSVGAEVRSDKLDDDSPWRS